jgi:hypothetical protein
MADLTNQLQATAGSGVAPDVDPNFKQTVLLLHGDGTNGAQNNTFLDGSTNNFTITRNGNTTQGTFSPFSLAAGEFSNFFDGSGDSLTAPDNAAFDVGSGDWTIECFANFSSVSGEKGLCSHFSSSGGNNGYTFRLSTGNSPSGFRLVCSGGGTGVVLQSAWTPVVGTWYHIAAVRDGGTLRAYVDGVEIGSTSIAITIGNPATTFAIGTTQTVASSDMDGYISNVRMIKGTCLYTGGTTFTPPSTPLTAVSGTEILTCQSNRFVDNSTNAFAITRNGDVSVTPFSPFSPSAAYSASTNGGSGYFDGNGDYLSIADAAGLRFGTGNFTIQAWIYRNAAGAVHSIAAKGGASTGWVFQVHSDNKLRFTQTTTNIDSTGTIPAGAWTHVAVVREGTGTNQTKLYINGVNDGQATVTTDFNQTEQLNIGANRGNSSVMNGYIAGFKYVVGTAETITVPTAPPTGGTALLNFTNAGILDNTGFNALETVADAQIDTTVKKYGTGSMEFDGTGDWLLIPDSPDLKLGTGNFTIEFWVYLNAISAARGFVAKGGASTGWLVSLVSTNTVRFTFTTSTITSTGTLAASTWYHIAVVREGTGSNQTKIYINGTNDGTGTVSTDFNQTESMYVGANRTGGDALNGYIDDLRITKGIARYTAAFTPPAKAFPDQ